MERLVHQPELAKIANELISTTRDTFAISIIGGDRISCCDEGVVCEIDGVAIGIATISKTGEMNSSEPTIVGVYVRKEYRRSGIGSGIFARAICRCGERGFEKVRVDLLSKGGKRLVERLAPELRGKLDIHDFSSSMPF